MAYFFSPSLDPGTSARRQRRANLLAARQVSGADSAVNDRSEFRDAIARSGRPPLSDRQGGRSAALFEAAAL
jgi:hypothetical protein